MIRKSIAAVITIISMVPVLYAAPMHNLYSDHRAMKVDDLLTVLVYESAKAGSQSGTSTSKQNGLGLEGGGGTGALNFLPSFGASGGNKVTYDGKGETTREGSLIAKISARVDQVMDNGNLVISGSKVVEINNEKEIIKISGIVRPQDIQTNNVIFSYNIADAQIMYSGKGTASTGRRPGILARVLNFIF